MTIFLNKKFCHFVMQNRWDNLSPAMESPENAIQGVAYNMRERYLNG